ncbi:hypothetical protein JCM15765_28390 [Paradesulfitobacterium aromaticivorans]
MAAARLRHGPFSHALEKTIGIKHEQWTVAIINGDTEINSILRTNNINPREVADVIQRTQTSQAVVKLLSSQLDTDRIDYLLRDSKMSGAGYGTFDLEWLIFLEMLSTYIFLLESGYQPNEAKGKAVELKPHLGNLIDESIKFYNANFSS